MKRLSQKEIGAINLLIEARTAVAVVANQNFIEPSDWGKKQKLLEAIIEPAGQILEPKGHRVKELKFALGDCPSSDWIAEAEWGISRRKYESMGIKISE
jgi:hypothetical protein